LKKVLIDGDIVGYRCAASCEPTREKLEREPLDLAILRADELMYRITSETNADTFECFISGTGNFRKDLFPEYKANREDKPRPVYLDAVRAFLVKEWDATIVNDMEADDAIGLAATDTTVIASIDKDLKQIPGEHYNFVKMEWDIVDEDTADLNFWKMMLIGDISDNLRGVDGIGPKKSQAMLSGLSSSDRKDLVKELYDDKDRFELNYLLFRIPRTEKELEATIGKKQGAAPTESNEGQNFSPFSTVNS
jgi:DNA polymerase-1